MSGGDADFDACGVCDGGEADPNNCFDTNTVWLQLNDNGNLEFICTMKILLQAFSLI